jgi:hypothetical protein
MSKIFCVDLTKYNQDQLTKISDIIGINSSSLIESKVNGTKRVYFDHENRLFIGELVKDDTKYIRSYKNLVLTEDFAHLSKREKDQLINMDPYKFNTKNVDKNDFFNSVVETKIDVSKSEVVDVVRVSNIVLEIDAILDKISDYGIKSLTKEEKDFLDKESMS